MGRGSVEPENELRTRIQRHADDATLHAELGRLLSTSGRLAEAVEAIRRSLSLDPRAGHVWAQLARVSLMLGDVDSASDYYLRADELEGLTSYDAPQLVITLIAAQRAFLAREQVKRFSRLYPLAASVQIAAGHVHRVFGESAEAIESYRRALRLDASSTEALFNLVDLDAQAGNESWEQRLLQLRDSDSLTSSDKANINFSLAILCDRRGNFGKAFEYFSTANSAAADALKSRSIVYRPDSERRRIDDTIEMYPERSVKKEQVSTWEPALNPIFIVGLPRSGTTLVEQILSSHTEVQAAGEVQLLLTLEREYRSRIALRAPDNVQGSTSVDNEAILDELRERYIDYLYARDLDSKFITNKHLGAFEILGFIDLLFPNANVIHCVRHPIATCWSIFRANLSFHGPYSNSLKHLAHYYSEYRRLMAHWSKTVGVKLLTVRYEELVLSMEQTVRSLLEGCGLTFDQRCLTPHLNRNPVTTASAQQVRRPVYQSSLAEWTSYERYLGELACLSGNEGSDSELT